MTLDHDSGGGWSGVKPLTEQAVDEYIVQQAQGNRKLDGERVIEILEGAIATFRRKEHDYARKVSLANFKRIRRYNLPAWLSVWVRLQDKQERIETMMEAKIDAWRTSTPEVDAGVPEESLADTLEDEIVYNAILMTLMEQGE